MWPIAIFVSQLSLAKIYQRIAIQNFYPKNDQQALLNTVLKYKSEENKMPNKSLINKIFIEQSPSAIAMFDTKMIYVRVSNKWLKDYGLEGRDIIGMSHYDVFPETGDNWKKIHEKCLKGQINICDENVFKRKDGTTQWLTWDIRPWFVSESNIGGLLMYTTDITDRKLTEEKLRISEEKLRKTQTLAKIGYWRQKSTDNQTLYWSDEVYNIWGVSMLLFDTSFKNFYNSIHPDDRNLFDTANKKAKKDKLGFKVEYRIILPDDTIKYVCQLGEYIYNNKGEKLGIEGTVQDITDRKKAEIILKESNQRYHYVTKATSEAIWDWDVENNQVLWGDGFETIFGYNLANIKNDITFQLDNIHPDDKAKLVESFYTLVKSTETHWEKYYRFLKADKTYVHIVNRGYVIRNEAGRTIRIVGGMRDITIKKQEELRLKLLESVITHTNDSVIITGAETIDGTGPKILYVNEAFTTMTGYKAEEVIGKTPRILQGPKTDRKELDRLKSALQKWEPCEITVINYKKNLKEFWINIAVSPVADAKGWFTHWIAIQRDVTESKLAEKIITKAIIKTQEDERYEIGGELHDNVCQILALSQISLKRIKKTLPLSELAMFEQGIDYISLASHEIRNLSHRLAPVFFNDTTLEGAFKKLIQTFNIEGNYEIMLNFSTAFKEFPATNEFQLNLYRILQEQLRNILKYANATEIRVDGFIDVDKIKIIIIDNGIGFNIKKIKDGIGLANMKRRIELFSGKFEVVSSLGNGCKILIDVPLKEIG